MFVWFVVLCVLRLFSIVCGETTFASSVKFTTSSDNKLSATSKDLTSSIKNISSILKDRSSSAKDLRSSDSSEKYRFRDKNESIARQQRILSRKRRYLIFPEGSSLQLVFCLTMPVIGYSTIFTIGDTLSLAWQLPDEPYQSFRKLKDDDGDDDGGDTANKRIDAPNKPIKYLPPTWSSSHPANHFTSDVNNFPSQQRVPPTGQYKNTYYKPYREGEQQYSGSGEKYNNIKSGYYSKTKHDGYYDRVKEEDGYYNSVEENRPPVISEYGWGTVARQPYQTIVPRIRNKYERYDKYERAPPPAREYTHPVYNGAHRRTRRDLYGKLEELLNKRVNDGKSCLLKAICEVSRSKSIGTFLEELIKTIFRVNIEGHALIKEDLYDIASNSTHNCDVRYPTCTVSFLYNK